MTILLGACYRAKRNIAAIRLRHAGSEEGISKFLPAGAILHVVRSAQFFRMFEAQWGGDFYAISDDDLITAAEEIGEASLPASPASGGDRSLSQ